MTQPLELMNDAIAAMKAAWRQAPRDQRDSLGEEVRRLIVSKINAQWDDLVSRTEVLVSAAGQLQSVIDRYSGAPSMAGALSTLAAAAGGLQRALGAGATRGLRRAAASSDEQPAREFSVLCVHGVGDHHTDQSWKSKWLDLIERGVRSWAPGAIVDADFVMYHDIVEETPLTALQMTEALWRLGTSGIIHGLGDIFGRRRSVLDVPHALRWTAGLVAQWASEEKLRERTRARLEEWLKLPKYNAVIGHSLGSLIMYDTLRAKPSLAEGLVVASFGSQIGNPFVRGTFGGRIAPIEKARRWLHIFNPDDRVFTSRVSLAEANFSEVEAKFDIPDDPLNHDALWYLRHRNVVDSLWREVAGGEGESGSGASISPDGVPPSLARAVRAVSKPTPRTAKRQPERRALLVGINDYPNPDDRLDGCVNDVFLMSSLLQELSGDNGQRFPPDSIRVVLNERATAKGILSRLQWLLEDVRAGDERVLYYSGHGAQVPAYGSWAEVDHLDECLVPHDFDWTPERSISDDTFFELYSQLPYESSFVAILDCCHSGGITRAGGAKVRGLNPPDDIRHRALKWDQSRGMWTPRDFNRDAGRGSLTDDIIAATDQRDIEKLLGESGFTHRLGSAAPLRRVKVTQSARNKQEKPQRPYMPMLIHACQENEFAFEYRHGVTSYGAFTYSLAQILRADEMRKSPITFKALVEQVKDRLQELKFDQVPSIRGPSIHLEAPVPWIGPTAGRPGSAGKKTAKKKPAKKRANRPKKKAGKKKSTKRGRSRRRRE